MQCNVGKTDRSIRIALGITILAIGMIVGSWWGLVGLVPLVTGVLRWCPLYASLSLSTCGLPAARQPR